MPREGEELLVVANNGLQSVINIDEEDRVRDMNELPQDDAIESCLLLELANRCGRGALARLDATARQSPDDQAGGTELLNHEDGIVTQYSSAGTDPAHVLSVG